MADRKRELVPDNWSLVRYIYCSLYKECIFFSFYEEYQKSSLLLSSTSVRFDRFSENEKELRRRLKAGRKGGDG